MRKEDKKSGNVKKSNARVRQGAKVINHLVTTLRPTFINNIIRCYPKAHLSHPKLVKSHLGLTLFVMCYRKRRIENIIRYIVGGIHPDTFQPFGDRSFLCREGIFVEIEIEIQTLQQGLAQFRMPGKGLSFVVVAIRAAAYR